MRVLITGGYGFIGSFVAEKFYQEGHDIFILDDLSSGKKENITFRHKSFITNVTSSNCEQIFKGHPFDMVIHLAANVNVSTSMNNPTYDADANIVGLLNMLHLSGKYGVKKFIFASSAAVYGDPLTIPIEEEHDLHPISPYGMSKQIGEYYCEQWSKLYQLDTLCLRFSNVFGPGQGNSGEAGVISIFLNRVMNKQKLVVFGDGTQTRDFIFVKDVTEAIYRSAMSELTGVYHVSTNQETTINEVIDEIKGILDSTGVGNLPAILYKDKNPGDIENSSLDNRKLMKEIDWAPKYTFSQGIYETFQWFYQQKTKSKQSKSTKQKPNKSKQDNQSVHTEKLIPLIENFVIFTIIVAAHFTLGEYFSNIDMKLLYVLIIALFFGKTQAVVSCALVIVLFSYENMMAGRDFITLFIDNEVLMQFAVYLFIGLIVGYIIDRKKIDAHGAKQELVAAGQKYDFLQDLYQEIRDQKEELETQIVESEDGIGKIYSMVQQLDSLEPDDIFVGATAVIEQTMKTNAAAIYLVNSNRYLRLVSKSRRNDLIIPSSIMVKDESVLAQVISSKENFFNKKFVENMPQMIAPIVKQDKTIAVVFIYEMNFENLTLYYQNLFHVIVSLISSSLIKATDYVQATNQERYYDGTVVLKPEYFAKILASKQKAWQQFKIPYTKLSIEKTYQLEQLNKVTQLLRETDYVGVEADGTLSILLANTDEKTAQHVITRLQYQQISVGGTAND